jgi:hypothetical protein
MKPTHFLEHLLTPVTDTQATLSLGKQEIVIESPIRNDLVLNAPVQSHFRKLVPSSDRPSHKMWN